MSESDQLVLYRAIVGYGLDGQEPPFDSSYLRMAWKLIKPQLDANWKRYENGCKGRDYGQRGGNPIFQKGKRNPYYNKVDNPKDNL